MAEDSSLFVSQQTGFFFFSDLVSPNLFQNFKNEHLSMLLPFGWIYVNSIRFRTHFGDLSLSRMLWKIPKTATRVGRVGWSQEVKPHSLLPRRFFSRVQLHVN